MFFSEFFRTPTYKWAKISVVNVPGYKCLHLESRLINGHLLMGFESGACV